MPVIDFKADTEFGVFSDALVLPDEGVYTDDEIEAMKKQRVDNWVAYVKAASLQVNIEEPQVVQDAAPIEGV